MRICLVLSRTGLMRRRVYEDLGPHMGSSDQLAANTSSVYWPALPIRQHGEGFWRRRSYSYRRASVSPSIYCCFFFFLFFFFFFFFFFFCFIVFFFFFLVCFFFCFFRYQLSFAVFPGRLIPPRSAQPGLAVTHSSGFASSLFIGLMTVAGMWLGVRISFHSPAPSGCGGLETVEWVFDATGVLVGTFPRVPG
jgi:hypothetical protein